MAGFIAAAVILLLVMGILSRIARIGCNLVMIVIYLGLLAAVAIGMFFVSGF